MVSYMRLRNVKDASNTVENCQYIIKDYKDYKGNYRVKNDANSQDAHEAIRPTNLDNDPDSIKQYLLNTIILFSLWSFCWLISRFLDGYFTYYTEGNAFIAVFVFADFCNDIVTLVEF